MPPPPTPSTFHLPQHRRSYSPQPPPVTQPPPAPSPPLPKRQQHTQRKRGRQRKSTEFAPELPATQVPYQLRSRSQVQETVLPEKPAFPRLIVPHFTLAAPPTQEGGGSAEQKAVDALKKRKKKSSEAWKQIQQRNYAFSGDTYILQSHNNEFIPLLQAEQEEPAELFSDRKSVV